MSAKEVGDLFGVSTELLSLPWSTLLTLASGYAGYFVANHGARDHHKTIDIAFSTLVFGFISAFVFQIIYRFGTDILSASLLSFASAMFAGAFWSRYGRRWLLRFLHVTDISHTSDLPRAWTAMFAETKVNGVTLSVKLRDGTWLKCQDLSRFRDAPNGPCVLGGVGDVLMYVTHQQNSDEDEFNECEMVTSSKWGDEVTYIPADQIARIDFRRIRKI